MLKFLVKLKSTVTSGMFQEVKKFCSIHKKKQSFPILSNEVLQCIFIRNFFMWQYNVWCLSLRVAKITP